MKKKITAQHHDRRCVKTLLNYKYASVRIVLLGFICTFATDVVLPSNSFVFYRNTKTSEFSDTTKSQVAFC